MLRKSFINLVWALFLINLFTGCHNSLMNLTTDKSDFKFSLGDSVERAISSAVSQNRQINDDSIFTISCYSEGLSLSPQVLNVKKNQIGTASFEFSDVPFNRQFKILIEISFNGIVIYNGESNPIELSNANNGLIVKVNIKPRKGKITYERGSGEFETPVPNVVVEEYFINDTISQNNLPTVKKEGFKFDGWFFDEKCTNPVVTLGKENYLGDVTLYAKFTDITPPGDIASFTALPADSKVSLSWAIPADKDIANFEIEYGTLEIIPDSQNYTKTKISTEKVPGNISSAEISGLTNGKRYYFSIIAVDSSGNKSIQQKEAISFANPALALQNNLVDISEIYESHCAPVVNPSKYYGQQSWRYVEFGYWPQTIKSAEVAIIESSTTTINGWNCYLGNDNNYYVKVENATPATPDYRFSDNTIIESGKTYYFKIEPIQWRIFSYGYKYNANNDSAALLVPEKAICGGVYATSASKEYKDSEVRRYLNDEFLNKAFSAKEKERLLINSEKDKVISIPSSVFTNPEMGFETYLTDFDTGRIRELTDYGSALGITKNIDTDKTKVILRSETEASPTVQKMEMINETGNIIFEDLTTETNVKSAYLPGIVIKEHCPATLFNFSIPKAGTKAAGKTMSFGIEGCGFTQLTPRDFKVSESSGNITGATVNIISDNIIEVSLAVPATAGTYDISVSCNGAKTVSSKLFVIDTASYNTGDLLLSDGSVAASADVASNISNTIGVLFLSDTGAAYGVGLEQSTQVSWNPSGLSADAKIFENNICTPDNLDNIASTKFWGDYDGSNNWAEICKVDSNNTTNTAANYPAYDYVEKYGQNMDYGFAKGWYMPTVYELTILNKSVVKVNETLNALNKPALANSYWSSSQVKNDNGTVWTVNFGAASSIVKTGKTSTNTVICIREVKPKEPVLKALLFPKIGTSGKQSVNARIITENVDPYSVTYTCTPGSGITDSLSKSGNIVGLEIPHNAGEYEVTANFGNLKVVGKLIVKNYKTYEIGDVLLNDGTVVKYDTLTTPEQKKSAVAVFYGCHNSYGAPLFLGLKESAPIEWAVKDTRAYRETIDALKCDPGIREEGPVSSANFLFDTNGVFNWIDFVKFYRDNETKAISDVPALSYGFTYGNTQELKDTPYKEGWFEPTIAELSDIYKSYSAPDSLLNTVISYLGGDIIKAEKYWSSTQKDYSSSITKAWNINFGTGNICPDEKDVKLKVRAILTL